VAGPPLRRNSKEGAGPLVAIRTGLIRHESGCPTRRRVRRVGTTDLNGGRPLIFSKSETARRAGPNICQHLSQFGTACHFFSAIFLTSLSDIHDNKYISHRSEMPAPTYKLFVSKILPITPLNSKISTLVPRYRSHSKRSGGRGWITIGGRPGTSLTKQTGEIRGQGNPRGQTLPSQFGSLLLVNPRKCAILTSGGIANRYTLFFFDLNDRANHHCSRKHAWHRRGACHDLRWRYSRPGKSLVARHEKAQVWRGLANTIQSPRFSNSCVDLLSFRRHICCGPD